VEHLPAVWLPNRPAGLRPAPVGVQEDKKTLPDNVKVTGRHALCTDCVAAYAQHLGTPPEGDAPQHASTPDGTPSQPCHAVAAHADECPLIVQSNRVRHRAE
jgi:hypothetical protein